MKTLTAADQGSGSSDRLASILTVSVSVFAATLLPLLLFLRRCSPFAETSLFQPDTFYYLVVAKNSLRTPFYSFDGVSPTNGFHPVWEYLLYRAMRINLLRPDDPFLTLHRLYIGNLLILSVACALLAAFCARHVHRGWLAFIAICPGFLWFAVALTAPYYLANWSYLNGMESAVELLFLGMALLVFSLSQETSFRLPIAMFLFGMMVLSRLDDVFLLLPVLVLVWKSHRKWWRTSIEALACVALTAVAFNIYANRYMSHSGGTWQNSILMQSQTLREMVRTQGSDRFIEMNDGELAYSTNMQTMSGQGLVLDPAAAKALAQGHFFEIASDRGYHLMMASGLYKDIIDAALEKRAQGSREGFFLFSDAELDRFRVMSVAYDPVSDTRLYSISRNP